MKSIIFAVIALAMLTATTTLAYAQEFDHGASIFAPGQEDETNCETCDAKHLAPGQESEAPGWDPNGAPKYAPGQQGLKDGIVGIPK